MKTILLAALLALASNCLLGQIGIGTQTPQATLDVNGTIKVGAVANGQPVKGTIRWNDAKNDFEGFNGSAWVSLTGGNSVQIGWGNKVAYSYESSASNEFLDQTNNNVGTELGSALALFGDYLAAGAFRDVRYGFNDIWGQGSVRIFKRNGDLWKQRFRLNDPDNVINDFFGYSIGISATHIISSAPNGKNAANIATGKAYVFPYTQDNVGAPVTLYASDAQSGDYFGSAVAISGDYAAVGASTNDVGGLADMGRAYVFQRNGSSWPQMSMITPPDGAAGDLFGYSLALQGDLLVIGAPHKSVNNVYQAGKVYVYRQSGSGWGLIASLTSPAPMVSQKFGYSVFIHGDKIVVGAPHNTNDGQGKVFLYSVQASSIQLHSTVEDPLGLPGDGFGMALSLYDDVLVVASRYASVLSGKYQGKAVVFRWQNNQWNHEAILTASRGESYMFFGTACAVDQWGAMVGAPGADFYLRKDNGEVFFFRR